jgi:mono/diheme cytochrome c family protein
MPNRHEATAATKRPACGQRSTRRRNRQLAVFAVLLVILGMAGAVLFVSARGSDSPSSPSTPVPVATSAAAAITSTDLGAITRGQTVYSARCLACHGAAGKGDGPAAVGLNPAPVDFTSPIHRGHRREDQIAWVTNGLPPSAMPAFGGELSPQEIEEVVDYIRALGVAGVAADGVDIPDPALCTIAPTDPAKWRPGPGDAPVPTTAPAPIVGPDFGWPQGEPASRAEIDGVTGAIRQFVACTSAGDQARRLSLYTERYIRPQFSGLDDAGWQQLITFAAQTPVAIPVEQRGGIQELRDVRRLADGRVGAYVSTFDPVNHPHETNAVVIFAKHGDQWLIDEIHGDPQGVLRSTPTPAAAPTPPAIPAVGPRTPVAHAGLILTLVEAPTQAGAGTVTLRISDAQGQPVDDATVTFIVEMLDMPMGVTSATGSPIGEGRYTTQASFAMTGRWQIRGQVQRPSSAPIAVAFELDIAAP